MINLNVNATPSQRHDFISTGNGKIKEAPKYYYKWVSHFELRIHKRTGRVTTSKYKTN